MFDYSGMEHGNQPATLDTILQMRGLAPDKRVGQLMHTERDDFCYTYDLRP